MASFPDTEDLFGDAASVGTFRKAGELTALAAQLGNRLAQIQESIEKQHNDAALERKYLQQRKEILFQIKCELDRVRQKPLSISSFLEWCALTRFVNKSDLDTRDFDDLADKQVVHDIIAEIEAGNAVYSWLQLPLSAQEALIDARDWNFLHRCLGLFQRQTDQIDDLARKFEFAKTEAAARCGGARLLATWISPVNLCLVLGALCVLFPSWVLRVLGLGCLCLAGFTFWRKRREVIEFHEGEIEDVRAELEHSRDEVVRTVRVVETLLQALAERQRAKGSSECDPLVAMARRAIDHSVTTEKRQAAVREVQKHVDNLTASLDIDRQDLSLLPID